MEPNPVSPSQLMSKGFCVSMLIVSQQLIDRLTCAVMLSGNFGVKKQSVDARTSLFHIVMPTLRRHHFCRKGRCLHKVGMTGPRHSNIRKTLVATLTLVGLLFFALNPISAQNCNLSLSGTVVDESTEKPLFRATIYVEETESGVVTDSTGEFKIEGLCPGEYCVSVMWAAKPVGCALWWIRIVHFRLRFITIPNC